MPGTMQAFTEVLIILPGQSALMASPSDAWSSPCGGLGMEPNSASFHAECGFSSQLRIMDGPLPLPHPWFRPIHLLYAADFPHSLGDRGEGREGTHLGQSQLLVQAHIDVAHEIETRSEQSQEEQHLGSEVSSEGLPPSSSPVWVWTGS